MGLFSRKISYKDAVIGVLNDALEIDIKSESAFQGHAQNNLEGLICVFWMVERSLHCLPDSKRELAGAHIFNELIDFLRDDYSQAEIQSLVVPAFMKRTAEYTSLFSIGADEEPRQPLLRTSARMVENVFGEPEAHIARTMAVSLLWLQPILAIGGEICELDKQRKIAW